MEAIVNEFVLVSPMGQVIAYAPVSAYALQCRYAGTEQYDKVNEFIQTAKPGYYLLIDDAHLLFAGVK
jgi:hypothetical protein